MLYRLFVLALLTAVSATAQTADSLSVSTSRLESVEVVMNDGTRYVGRIVFETATALTLALEDGVQVIIPTDRIASRRVFDSAVALPLRADPNRSRLLFAPTARAIGEGNGYIANYEVFFPFVAVGAGPNVSLAGGITLFPTTEFQIAYVAPKVTVLDADDVQVAAGFLGAIPLGGGGSAAGLAYGVATVGSSQRAVTAGAGYGNAFDGGNGVGVILLGGEQQISNAVKLISENYVFLVRESTGFDCGGVGQPCVSLGERTDATLLLSGGIRFFGEELAADIALFTSPELTGVGIPFFPWFGFAYNF